MRYGAQVQVMLEVMLTKRETIECQRRRGVREWGDLDHRRHDGNLAWQENARPRIRQVQGSERQTPDERVEGLESRTPASWSVGGVSLHLEYRKHL